MNPALGKICEDIAHEISIPIEHSVSSSKRATSTEK